MLKLYEEFIKDDGLNDVIKQLETRAKYWFENGEIGKEINLNSIEPSQYTHRSYKSIIISFNNDNYMYQVILTVDMETPDKCQFKMKRYDLNNNNLIDAISEEVDVDDVKEDLIITKISEFEEKDEDPDKNKIKVQEEPEEKEQTEEEFGGGEGGGFAQGGESPQEEEGGFELGGPEGGAGGNVQPGGAQGGFEF